MKIELDSFTWDQIKNEIATVIANGFIPKEPIRSLVEIKHKDFYLIIKHNWTMLVNPTPVFSRNVVVSLHVRHVDWGRRDEGIEVLTKDRNYHSNTSWVEQFSQDFADAAIRNLMEMDVLEQL